MIQSSSFYHCFTRVVSHGYSKDPATPHCDSVCAGSTWRILAVLVLRLNDVGSTPTWDDHRWAQTFQTPGTPPLTLYPTLPSIDHSRPRYPQPTIPRTQLEQRNTHHTGQNKGTRETSYRIAHGAGRVDDPSAMLIPSVGFPHLCRLSPITPRRRPYLRSCHPR
ncbi:hypothetical protein CORC01_02753 [Colletotrichum orchidophilum]|uniref:Uncharacterized protein n=1 Tax=Colletotrichum orchidophilum TaxID=1209926 RepID=A0A1G4BKL1_9PEZI|nr:uncharacterized protein CORC01_02753 [Colletotrichum orchidophilum]OHF01875.1 hypothetical protein CORC01_02753 [Colletotrichum orchidophilum]